MLTNIENRLEELFEQIEMMPQDEVEAAEKVKLMTWLSGYGGSLIHRRARGLQGEIKFCCYLI